MLIVFVRLNWRNYLKQHLGRMAVDMARDGKAEAEVWSSIAERFKSTMLLKSKSLYTHFVTHRHVNFIVFLWMSTVRVLKSIHRRRVFDLRMLVIPVDSY